MSKGVKANPPMLAYEGRYIQFILTGRKSRTEVYAVFTNDGSWEWLGDIRWFPAWRKYAFFPHSPDDKTVFEETCLGDIIHFLNMLKEARKAKRPIPLKECPS